MVLCCVILRVLLYLYHQAISQNKPVRAEPVEACACFKHDNVIAFDKLRSNGVCF